jgi:hypothetical protein
VDFLFPRSRSRIRRRILVDGGGNFYRFSLVIATISRLWLLTKARLNAAAGGPVWAVRFRPLFSPEAIEMMG